MARVFNFNIISSWRISQTLVGLQTAHTPRTGVLFEAIWSASACVGSQPVNQQLGRCLSRLSVKRSKRLGRINVALWRQRPDYPGNGFSWLRRFSSHITLRSRRRCTDSEVDLPEHKCAAPAYLALIFTNRVDASLQAQMPVTLSAAVLLCRADASRNAASL
jgi:hypothetical protein